MRLGLLLNCLIVLSVLPAPLLAAGKTGTVNLRAERLTDPAGIGVRSPELSWETVSADRGVVQTYYRIRAAHSEKDLKAGRNLTWDSGRVESGDSYNVTYIPGLSSREKVWWQVMVWTNKGVAPWSEPATFEAGLLDKIDWSARWIRPDIVENATVSTPPVMLRKEFSLKKDIARARIYVSAQGIFELRLNGAKVGDELFAPGWTTYGKRIQYRVYDVTASVISGDNAIGLVLGDGWYRGYLRWNNEKNHYGEAIAALLQLEVTYTDGSKETVVTDRSWRSSNEGPLRMADLYNGETYDASLEKAGWDMAGYDDGAWRGVAEKEVTAEIVASESVPVRILSEIQPTAKIITPRNETVIDFGQNMLGWVAFRLQAPKGSKITLKFGEVLDPEGNFYNANLRTAKAEDTYIFKGVGVETYEPRFTFHGFRYMKIENFEGKIDPANFTAKFISSDVAMIGSFECSDPLVNRLQSNLRWSLQDNFLDVPTDCPQRDERLGWTGDAQAIAPTACFNVDAAPFWRKWMKDLALDQLPDGSVPHVIPAVKTGSGSAGWSDAATMVPWAVYKAYGDVEILRNQYESMKAWVEFMKKEAGESLIRNTGQRYGDWLAYATTNADYPGATTDKDLLGTAFFAHSTDLLARSADLLGNSVDAKKYRKLFEDIKAVFQKEFMTPAGRLSSNTQTAYVIALYFDLLPDELREIAAKRLVDDVKKFGHITTGFLGTPLICQVLSEYGYDEEAYMLLLRTKYPSWLYPVTMGATTIWERWDAIRPDGSFNSLGMNSFNHYAYGAIGDWLYSRVAGIKQEEGSVAYKNIVIEPIPTEQLTYAWASHHSMFGEVSSRWEISGDTFSLTVSIPVNTTARVILPTSDASSVTESGKKIEGKGTIVFAGSANGKTTYTTGSGTYRFSCKMK